MKALDYTIYQNDSNGKTVIELVLPEDYVKVRFEFYSDRNEKISSLTDVSPMDPDQRPGSGRYPKDMNIWFPVVDLELEPTMYAKAGITGAEYCQINSFFNPEQSPIEHGEAVFSPAVLSDWENGLFVPAKHAGVHSFVIVKELFAVPTISRTVFCEFRPFESQWGGRIEVFYQNQNEEWKHGQTIPMSREKDCDFSALGTGDHEEAVNLCIDYLIQSCNRAPANPYQGGLFLFYDCDADTYRNGQWPWSWGPAVKFLLECARLAESGDSRIRIRRSAGELKEMATQIGLTTLKFQIKNKDHIANGFGTTRYTPRNFSDVGYEELVNTGSDTGFLCGWAWIPLYEATGDSRFLNAAREYLAALNPILEEFVIPPQEWLPQREAWTDFTIDESGFGTEGIAAVYQVTNLPEYQELCTRYMNQHLAVFEREDGLWDRQYRFDTGKVEETIGMTRGLGWAMEGLLAAHRCVPEGGRYLEKAKKMADYLISCQRENGSWGFLFTDKESDRDAADKGTALWCLLLYMLYEETKETYYLESAQRALNWCMQQQYVGSNIHARGGIISVSGESGITYRPYYRMCCQYTSGFFGLALLKEIAQCQKGDHGK